ncbi:hypothetical protein AVEN_31879-1 [Araneus ventricosus]|uniref:Gustatory receptor n=1 Tax=Araneus ventricosus TaxID=182803 RepID=A0A4Y2F6S6_ARAVE|nr:hypothetical protein AVEN_31879-1 [Araneus ventricosus]
MYSLESESIDNSRVFLRKATSSFNVWHRYKLLWVILQFYGIDVYDKDTHRNLFYKCFQAMTNIFIHLYPVYRIPVSVAHYLDNHLHFATLIGLVFASIFPLAIKHSINLKKCLLRKIFIQYHKMDALQNQKIKGKYFNWVIIITVLISFVLASASALTLSYDIDQKLSFSFYKDLGEGFVGYFVPFIMNHLVFAYQYEFPCLVASLSGMMYYEFSRFLLQLRENLELQRRSLDRNQLMSLHQTHTLLFYLVHKLLNATSLPCLFILCSQMTSMYCALALFVVYHKDYYPLPTITDWFMSLILGTASLSGLIMCASKINTEFNRIQKTALFLKDELMKEQVQDAVALDCVNALMEKQFPVMTASGFVDLTPDSLLGMIGSLFTYTLLILNLKQ